MKLIMVTKNPGVNRWGQSWLQCWSRYETFHGWLQDWGLFVLRKNLMTHIGLIFPNPKRMILVFLLLVLTFKRQEKTLWVPSTKRVIGWPQKRGSYWVFESEIVAVCLWRWSVAISETCDRMTAERKEFYRSSKKETSVTSVAEMKHGISLYILQMYS